MIKNKTVTVGIPAYNEEANIGKLLRALLSQKQKSFILDRIIVISDASSDRTVEIVQSLKNKKIVVMQNVKRVGKAETQNFIINNTNTDILILLDADVIPATDNFVDKLISPFNDEENIGLVGAKVLSLKPNNWLEKILVHISKVKTSLYEDINYKNNIYLCHGCARAFDRNFYKKLTFPKIPAEDAYSYLICKKLGFKFYYQPKAVIYYRNPSNLKDHVRQSKRFFWSKRNLSKYFSKDILKKEYYISINKFLKYTVIGFVKDPIRSVSYLPMLAFSKISSHFDVRKDFNLWDISVSSKNT